jgi:hypothetical protein
MLAPPHNVLQSAALLIGCGDSEGSAERPILALIMMRPRMAWSPEFIRSEIAAAMREAW